MRKVGARILLCLMLVIALVTSTLTAFAEPNTTEVPEGLDLSKFVSVDLKDVGGVYNGNLCIKEEYDYFLLYADSESYYTWFVGYSDDDEEEDSSFESISVDDANKYISDESNYNASYGYKEGYSIIESIEYLDEISNSKKVYILLHDGKEFYNLGLFDNYTDLEKNYPLDLSTKLPELNAQVNNNRTKATVEVTFSSKSGVSSIVCKDSDGNVVKNYEVPDEDSLSGKCVFTISANGEYVIEGYNDYYISPTQDHSSVSVTVSGLTKTSSPQEVSAKKVDTKAPKVTFSKLPKSALTNSEVEVTMYSNEPAKLVFNGQSSDGYVKKMKVKVKCNGKYTYSATDKDSNLKDGNLNVKFFKDAEGFNDAKRDNFWNNPNSPIATITSKLPQTGSVGWYWMIAFGVALVGVGGFVVFKATKSRKNKGIENK